MPDGSYHIERYKRTRFFALYDNEGLLAVTAYRKGACTLKDRLEAQDRTIAELQQQFNEMALAFAVSVPFDSRAAPEQTDSPTVHEEIAPFCRQL
jgi:hypothetical protein